MKLKTLIIVFLICHFQEMAFGKILYFVKNNQELKIPSEREFADLEARLQTILNTYYGGQSVVVRVLFIDTDDDVISSLMEWLGLVKQEEQVDQAICQDVEIIFEWRNNGWTYKETLFTKNDLIESRFLPKVKEFINEHALQGLTNERDIIRKWLVLISNVLDQQWKNKILSEGPVLVGVQGYHRGHRLAHWMQPDYMYDLEPHSTDSASASMVTYISNAKATNRDYKEYEFMPTLVKWLTAFEYHNPYSKLSEVEDNLFVKVRDREDYANKKPNHDLVTTGITNDTSFHKRNRDSQTKLYRLKLVEVPIADNEEYNLFSDLARFGWKHTSCNFFAFDLQKKVFGRYLWPLNCAFGSTAISNYLPTDPNFKKIPLDKILLYADAGFFIVCVQPGHVATIYPDGKEHLVQAGRSVGNQLTLGGGFGALDKVDAYIYLGYILN